MAKDDLVERLRKGSYDGPTAREAAARITALEAENARMRGTGQFLLDRIDALEWLDDGYAELIRDWMGHVDPALDRFRTALASGDVAKGEDQ